MERKFTVACNGPYGVAGLGRHLEQVTEGYRAAGRLAAYYCLAPQEGDTAGHRIEKPLFQRLKNLPPYRFSAGQRNWLSVETFDRAVAAQLKNNAPGQDAVFVSFGGMALHSFAAARRAGFSLLHLEAANSHVNNVMRRHAAARKEYPLEESWLNQRHAAKTVREYEEADTIVAASEYTRRALIENGVPEAKIQRRVLQVDARFVPPAQRSDDGVFRIVYVGSLTVAKGVAHLLDAFASLPIQDAKLTLVGGWQSRGMRRFIEERLAKDPRISVAPGDPLPHLQAANVCVHPTWEDGFAYSPAEALACGTPIVVTSDTGMNEYVEEGKSGFIFEAGQRDELIERLLQLHRQPLWSTRDLLPPAARHCPFFSELGNEG